MRAFSLDGSVQSFFFICLLISWLCIRTTNSVERRFLQHRAGHNRDIIYLTSSRPGRLTCGIQWDDRTCSTKVPQPTKNGENGQRIYQSRERCVGMYTNSRWPGNNRRRWPSILYTLPAREPVSCSGSNGVKWCTAICNIPYQFRLRWYVSLDRSCPI